MNYKRVLVVAAALVVLGAVPAAHAQDPSIMKYRWSFDVGMGWDHGISGNINSGAVGRLNDQITVILPNSYEEVYGTGFHLRFGGGYLIDDVTEVRAFFTYQSLSADLAPFGDIGSGKLYAQFDPYKSFGLDVGFRRYYGGAEMRVYTEGTFGLGFISEIDAVLSAPTTNLTARATDFYDRTAAFALGGNIGLVRQVNDRVGLYGQIGLRWMSGLSAVDNLEGTGLETINDDSDRWTVPIVFGTRIRF